MKTILLHRPHFVNRVPAPSGGGLSWPNDPYLNSVAGWTFLRGFDCASFEGDDVSMPPTLTEKWIRDTEYNHNPEPQIVTDGASPTGLQVWKYSALVSQFGVSWDWGGGVGTIGYKFATPPRKLYHGAYIKFSNPFEVNCDEIHSLYYQPFDAVIDFFPDGSLLFFSSGEPDSPSDNNSLFSIGNWFRIECLIDCLSGLFRMWVDGTAVIWRYIAPPSLESPINLGGATTVQWIDFNSTMHGAGTPTVDTFQYVAHNRLSVYV